MMSQKFMTGSRLEGRGGRSLRIISIAEAGPAPLTLKGRSLRLPLPPIRHRLLDGTVREAVQLVRHAERSSGLIIMTETIPVVPDRIDQQLAQQGVEAAGAEGVELVGPGGLLRCVQAWSRIDAAEHRDRMPQHEELDVRDGGSAAHQ
jgi:hypothetical protein